MSPQVGELDEAAFDEALRDDPDEALALLADPALTATWADGLARIDRLVGLLRQHVVAADGQARRPLAPMFIETTLDRLDLARSSLTGDGPVTTVLSGPAASTTRS